MCGVYGVIAEEERISILGELTEVFRHRGPDSSGVWRNRSVMLGHCRLAILDVSPAGHQPMVSSSGRFVVTYNGEIYNYRALRDELGRGGRSHFRGNSDTEVLLEAFEQWGLERTLETIDGIYAFALIDLAEKRLLLARDRFGVKPLVFGWKDNLFFFASDTRFVRALPGDMPELDTDGLRTFLRYGYIAAPYTIFEGVHKLQPASYAELPFDMLGSRASYSELEGRGCIRRYWPSGRIQPIEIGEKEALLELERRLDCAIKSQMVADVPLGAFLSGGIDSSLIVAMMTRHAAGRVKTFSIGFEESFYNEAPYARAVAQHLGTDHHEFLCGSDTAMAIIPRLAEMYDEPFGDSSQIPTVLVSQHARRHVTVALSGDAGDELFGGYPRYFWALNFSRMQRLFPSFLRTLAAKSIELVGIDRWQWLLERNRWAVPRSVPIDSAGLSAMTVGRLLRMDDEAAVYDFLMSQWPRMTAAGALGSNPCQHAHQKIFEENQGLLMRQMTAWDMSTYLPDDILVKVDRASMWWGLEARVPFLDRHLVEFVLSLPSRLRFSREPSKRLLREILYKMVPRTLVDRGKQGFGVPIDRWLRGPLSEWAESLLPRAQELFDRLALAVDIRKEWGAYVGGAGRWNPGLWSALMYASWVNTSSLNPRPKISF